MVDYAGGATGALSGAGTGFAIGGPIGAAVGGVAGGAAGLFGNKRKKKKISTFDSRQKKLNKQQFEGLSGEGPLADLYNYNPDEANAVFEQTIANPAYRNFQEKLAPNITGQFRSNGLINSSYAGDALAKAGRDVQESLDAQRAKYLYGERTGAREAKRNAVESFQNRNTQAYDKAAPNGFNIDSILKSISPEMIESLAGIFKGKPETTTAGTT